MTEVKGNVIVGQSGGPTAVINSSLAGVYKTAKDRGAKKVFGMLHGIQGLLKERYVDLSDHITSDLDIELLKRTPSAYLGSCRYKLPDICQDREIYDRIFAILDKLEIEYFFYIGGNDSMDTIKKLSDYALLNGSQVRFMGVPKTIDNDLWGTEMTFGFNSAVEIATNVIDCIHTTATSHGRVFIVEIMGHKVGWLTLYAGIAGGADVILLPEIPYDINKVVDSLYLRTGQGKRFCILAVAEGALSKKEAEMSKKEFKASRANMSFPSVSYRVAHEIVELTGREVRVTVPGHFQRGGGPCPYDRLLATRFGTAAVRLIEEGNFGNMVALQNGNIVAVPLSEVAGKLKYVPKDSNIIQSARDVGICFGD